MNEIFIRKPKFMHSWKYAAMESYFLVPLGPREFCKNKYLYLQKSSNWKTEVEKKRKETGPGLED